ncbi:MAG: TetR-like C-terminal domain-containing protein [Actinomycetota bacterium]
MKRGSGGRPGGITPCEPDHALEQRGVLRHRDLGPEEPFARCLLPGAGELRDEAVHGLERLRVGVIRLAGRARDIPPVCHELVEGDQTGLYRLVFLRVVPDLELGPAFGQVAYAAFDRMKARVAQLARAGRLGDQPVQECALAFHALTEGLASMEVRGAMLDPANAERVWRGALTSLVRGFGGDR